MGEVVGLLDDIDATLESVVIVRPLLSPADAELRDTLDDIEEILDGLPEEGIRILPTAPDMRDQRIGALTCNMLPPVVRQIGMPLAAIAGQRTIFYEI